MSKFRKFNKKERIKIYRCARRMMLGKEKDINACVGLCQFIADAIIKIHGVNYWRPWATTKEPTSPFHKTMIETYWPELYAQKPKGSNRIYWWVGPRAKFARKTALNKMIGDKK